MDSVCRIKEHIFIAKRVEKRERYYKKEKRGSKVREGVIIIPPTPNSILAKEMKKICAEELKGSDISLVIQERGGRRLAQELGVTVPGKSESKNCQRFNCFPCNSGIMKVFVEKQVLGIRSTAISAENKV